MDDTCWHCANAPLGECVRYCVLVSLIYFFCVGANCVRACLCVCTFSTTSPDNHLSWCMSSFLEGDLSVSPAKLQGYRQGYSFVAALRQTRTHDEAISMTRGKRWATNGPSHTHFHDEFTKRFAKFVARKLRNLAPQFSAAHQNGRHKPKRPTSCSVWSDGRSLMIINRCRTQV